MDYAKLLKSSFDPFFEAPLTSWEDFAGKCRLAPIEKDRIIKHHDTRETHFYFILQGAVGLFLWKENNPVCLDFAFDGQFCSDYMSLLTNEPTPLQMIALEDCTLLSMTKENYLQLTSTPSGQLLRLVAAEASFIDKQRQQIELLTKSAKERYHLLLKQFPNIHNRISQNHIASYLGITPQSLSRIKRER